MSHEHCALPSDVPGYHGSEDDYVEPVERCHDCGEVVPSDAKFCENCLDGGTEPVCQICGESENVTPEICPMRGNFKGFVVPPYIVR